MKNISTKILKQILNTDFELVYIMKDGSVIFTDNEEEPTEDIEFCFFTSDFEIIFDIQRELKERGVSK